MRSRLLIAIAALSMAMPALAAPSDVRRLDGTMLSPAEIDATVIRLMTAAEVTGVGITVFNDGKVAYSKAYGFRDVEKRLPLTQNSVMAGASFTKVALTYLVMQLVDQHVLDLDTPVQKYLPAPIAEYPAYSDLAGEPRAAKITARMLLTHTAGFPNFRRFNDDKKLNINFEPGTQYAYSGEGMQLLQLVVETVTRQPLQRLMQDRVFKPLGMRRTSMLTEPRFENDYANAYDEWGRSLGHQQRRTADAAGSMQTSLHDMTAFVGAIVSGRGLTANARAQMLSPQIRIDSRRQFPTLPPETTDANDAIQLSYGLGWGLYTTPYGKAFIKEGHDNGARNYVVVFDKPGIGLLIMTNSSNGEGIFKELLETLLRNPYTPIEWEAFTPYTDLPPRKPLPLPAP
jgi:CubicO group peptidase (beta-lactamase class C family)